MMIREVMDDGQGSRQGRSGQEGQAQEGQQDRQVEFDFELIFHELLEGREDLLVPTCTVCGVTEEDHMGRQHAFTPEGTRVDTAQFGPRRTQHTPGGSDVPRRVPTAWGASQEPSMGDPVLRQALVDKGILTADDLMAAATKISAITGQVMRGG